MSQALASTAARAARSAIASRAADAASAPGSADHRAARGVRTGSSTARGQGSLSRREPLRVVQAPPTTGSPLGFALICVGLLAAGLISLLLLNTAVAQDSFGLQRLQDNAKQLADQRQALIQSNDLAASPAQLSAKAWALGLVPSAGAAFLELPSGKVLGVAVPAPRAKPPTVITSTTGNISAYGTTNSSSNSSNSGNSAQVTNSVPDPGTAPGLAPAGPVSQTATTGTGPAGVAPAPPAKTAAPGTTGTTGTAGTTQDPPTKTR